MKVIVKVSDLAQEYVSQNGYLADGERHFLEVLQEGGNIVVHVDGKMAVKASNLVRTLQFTPTKMEFGQLALSSTVPASTAQWPQIGVPYEGTIQDIRLESESYQFYQQNGTVYPVAYALAVLASVLEGEVSDDVCARTNPCDNNGTCQNVFFNDFA